MARKIGDTMTTKCSVCGDDATVTLGDVEFCEACWERVGACSQCRDVEHLTQRGDKMFCVHCLDRVESGMAL